MPEHSPPSPNTKPTKRARQSSYDDASPTDAGTEESPANGDQTDGNIGSADKGIKTSAASQQSSTFRNVSACNRCRLRKNRCDQKLPSCASCAKARVACVGYDPITKKEIPRRFVAMAHATSGLGSRTVCDSWLTNIQLCLLSRDPGRPARGSTYTEQYFFPGAGRPRVMFSARSATCQVRGGHRSRRALE